MRMMNWLFSALIVGSASSALASSLSCDAYMALNRYHIHVDLDRDTNWMTVTGEGGEVYRGFSVYSLSTRNQRDYYYLPYAFENKGIEVRIDSRGTVFCPKVNECYACN